MEINTIILITLIIYAYFCSVNYMICMIARGSNPEYNRKIDVETTNILTFFSLISFIFLAYTFIIYRRDARIIRKKIRESQTKEFEEILGI